MNKKNLKGVGVLLFILLITMAFIACGSSSSNNNGGGGVLPDNPRSASAFPDSADNFEPDDSAASPSSIGVGDDVQVRTLFPVRNWDWIAVDLTAGVPYEIFTTNLNETGDRYIYLYDTDGTTQVDSNDDYLDYDSRITYMPSADGTYFIQVRPYDESHGVVSYSLGVREFVDSDSDAYSAFYDCDDDDDTIAPFESEVPGDGIDQSCSGTDELVGTTTDSAESDNVYTDAVAMVEAGGSLDEIIYRNDIYSGNARTIHAAGDIDFFVVTVPAHTHFEFGTQERNLPLTINIYESDGTTLFDTQSSGFSIEKDSMSRTFYISYEASNGTDTGYYLPWYYSLGTDQDDDGYHTQDWDSSRDCDECDANINSGAAETIGDGIDSNCDSFDD